MKTKYILLIGLVVLLVGSIGIIFLNNDLGFEYNGVELTNEEYNTIQKELSQQPIKICNLKNNQCIVMIPIN